MTYSRAQNPLIRDGVTQQQRQPSALAPDSARFDEKDLADFLVFAHGLSKQVTFHDLPQDVREPIETPPTSTWQPFFEHSAPVLLAQISKTRPSQVQAQYEQARQIFLRQWAVAPVGKSGGASPRHEALRAVFNVYDDILSALGQWYERLEQGTSLAVTMRDSVAANLPAPLSRLYRLEQELAKVESPASDRLTGAEGYWSRLGLPARPGDRNDAALGLQQLITNRSRAQVELDGIFRPLFQTYLRVIQQAPQALQQSLEINATLDPHVALYIALWEILRPAVQDLNRMTERHLDFFYRQVLALAEQPAQPDRAHLVLTLANVETAHRLAPQTRFNAGPDATGTDRIYVLADEMVVNTAQVAELKGLWLHHRLQPGAKVPQRMGHGSAHPDDKSDDALEAVDVLGLHASPVANSVDGQGGDFPTDQAVRAWLPFGHAQRPRAAVGLVVASPLLLLPEGDRTLTFQLALSWPTEPSALPSIAQLQSEISVELSGATAWLCKSNSDVTVTLTPVEAAVTGYRLTVTVKLSAADDPVLPYRPTLPGATLDTTYPVARLVLRHRDQPPQDSPKETLPAAVYHSLREAKLTALTLTTDVRGVRNLLLQNDLAPIDITKPFQPFGPRPKVDSRFYIGSYEVFHKPLTKLTLSYTLETEPPTHWPAHYAAYGVVDTFQPGTLTLQALRQRQWQPLLPRLLSDHLFTTGLSAESPLGEPAEAQVPVYRISLEGDRLRDLTLVAPGMAPQTEVLPDPLTPQSQSGFLRLQLSGDDFRHGDYPMVLARQVLATATQDSIVITDQPLLEQSRQPNQPQKRKAVVGAYYCSADGTVRQASRPFVELDDVPILPPEPYTPVIQSLQIDYSATISYSATAAQLPGQLFYLHPFEGVEALPTLGAGDLPPPLLPQFVNEGELLIGLRNLQPATALTLLFQVAAETVDTELKKTLLTWHYLKDNTWKPFEAYQLVNDTTQGWIRSGLVKLAIPPDISRVSTTILNPDLHWIKASVARRSGAIAQMLGVWAQAAEVVFVDSGNDSSHLATPLPPATIAALVDSTPEVAQIQQPFASFGGRVQEPPLHFYTRVSEHLRHKGRAVTIFDYERLVLERFPEIYKVRCINHGQMAGQNRLREIEPGYVTLVVIPTLAQRPTANDLEPKVNINLLDDIKTYLTDLSSQWADICVVNPRYEKIYVNFQVQFRDPYQAEFSFYQRQLERDIIGFLSPWTVSGDAEIHFGGEIYPSSIVDFVEKRPYVDYLINFELFHQKKPGETLKHLAKATATTAQSILVSAPPKEAGDQGGHHGIAPVEKLSSSARSTGQGLGYQTLDRLLVQPDP